MYNVDSLTNTISLGNQDENLIRTLEFDCSSWLTQWPGSTFRVLFEMPDSNDTFPLPDTQYTLDGTTLRVTVERNMTHKPGTGRLVISMVGSDDEDKRSVVVETFVKEGLSTTTPPPVIRNWIDTMNAGLNTFTESVEVINQASADATAAAQSANAALIDVTAIKDRIFDDAYRYAEKVLSQLDGTQYVPGFNAAPQGSDIISVSSNTLFDSYLWIADTDTQIYVVTSIPYYSICIGHNPTGPWILAGQSYTMRVDSAVRYRKSESNLPTASEPLAVQAGDAVAITVTAGSSPTLFIQEAYDVVSNLFASEVINAGNLTSNKIKVRRSETQLKLTTGKYEVTFNRASTTQGYQWNLDGLSGGSGKPNILIPSTDIIGIIQFDASLYSAPNFMGGGMATKAIMNSRCFLMGRRSWTAKNTTQSRSS